MEATTRMMIRDRARAMAERAAGLLQDDPEDTTAAAAFKYGYLVLRGPADFLSRFGIGSLSIDVDEVVDFAWSMRHELVGCQELMPEEIEIIDEHNTEADRYVGERTGSVVQLRR
jgi:hypothetical protein